MLSNRTGHLDDRRRRVLTEEVIGAAAPADAADEAGGRRRRSDDGAKGARMSLKSRRVNDLVPRGWLAIAGWLTLAVLLIAGLEALYFYMPKLAPSTTDGRVAALDLDGEGGLAVWFSSTLLLLAAGMTWIVYGMRRQQPDDYHGHYRVWLWAAVCWAVMSLDESASLHEAFKELMSQQTGQRLYGDGSLWWVISYGVVLGAVGLRLVWDMRLYRLSTAVFLAAGTCFALAVAAQLELILPASGARGVMLEEGLEMVGDVLLLLAMTLHARYLIFVAEGIITPRKVKAKRRRSSESAPPKRRSDDGAARERPEKTRRPWFGWLKRARGADDGPPDGKPRRAAASGEHGGKASIRQDSGAQAGRSGSGPLSGQVAAQRSDGASRVDSAESLQGRHRMSKSERKAMRRHQRSDDYDDDDDE